MESMPDKQSMKENIENSGIHSWTKDLSLCIAYFIVPKYWLIQNPSFSVGQVLAKLKITHYVTGSVNAWVHDRFCYIFHTESIVEENEYHLPIWCSIGYLMNNWNDFHISVILTNNVNLKYIPVCHCQRLLIICAIMIVCQILTIISLACLNSVVIRFQ